VVRQELSAYGVLYTFFYPAELDVALAERIYDIEVRYPLHLSPQQYYVVNANRIDPNDPLECPICLDEITSESLSENPGSVVQLKCRGKHIYHKHCIEEEYENRIRCPYCRDEVVGEEI
jgi:hypothetical protein